MNIIGEISNKDVYPEREVVLGEELEGVRKATRIILFDSYGNIAVGFYPKKENIEEEYNLPGGGIDEGETIEEGLRREVLEETGCNIKNVKEVGLIKEAECRNLKIRRQESYCFVAEVDGEKGICNFTEREIKDCLELHWFDVEDVLERIRNQKQSFERNRSIMLLEYYIKNYAGF